MSNRKMPILPVEAYTSQEWFDKEQKIIFGKSWQFAGLVEDIQDPGDYIAVRQVGNNGQEEKVELMRRQ